MDLSNKDTLILRINTDNSAEYDPKAKPTNASNLEYDPKAKPTNASNLEYDPKAKSVSPTNYVDTTVSDNFSFNNYHMW
jgi:hypothetical protein